MAGTSYKGSEIKSVDQFIKDKADSRTQGIGTFHFSSRTLRGLERFVQGRKGGLHGLRVARFAHAVGIHPEWWAHSAVQRP